jgi:hypothetical protein
VKQEAADELVGAERHDLLAIRAIAVIILVAEGDARLIAVGPILSRASRQKVEAEAWAGAERTKAKLASRGRGSEEV